MKNNDTAKYFEEHLAKNGFGTKILPEALDWHYAGVWDHLLKQYNQYRDVDLEEKYKKTGQLLRSSVCINIPLVIDEKTIDKLTKVIIEFANIS